MADIETGIFGAIFSWFGSRKAAPESKTLPRRPSIHDMTGGQPANEELLLGLYHGTFPGLEKATPLARVPINVCTGMMGIPTPTSKDEKTQAKLNEIRSMMMQEIKLNNKLYALIGTSWVYPKWDSKTGQGLIWKILRDSHVTDILMSINTDLPVGVVTDEQINVSVGENDVKTIRRKTKYTKDLVSIEYQGSVRELVKDTTSRNVAQTLPIMFAHDPDDMVSRGHSLIEPCLCDFKDYHDIDYRVSETLARFRVKQIQKIRENGLAAWRKNNGLESDDDLLMFDIADQDLLFCMGEENTDYKFLPADATQAGEKTLERLAWKIICGTETPEIFFGRAVSGNLGSYEEQMNMMITKVKRMREELNFAYQQLFRSSLILCGIVDMTRYDLNFEMNWNRLSALSETDKADILQKFCAAMSQATTAGSIGIHQLYKLWTEFYPDVVTTEDEFKAELVKNANLQQFIKQDYSTGETLLENAGGEKEVIDRVIKDDL